MSLRDTVALGHIDFESIEFYIRSSMHSLGGKILEELLNSDNGGYQGINLLICDSEAEFKEYRDKKVQTVLGSVSVKRAYYNVYLHGWHRCSGCKK